MVDADIIIIIYYVVYKYNNLLQYIINVYNKHIRF